jgi:hypothetical protein
MTNIEHMRQLLAEGTRGPWVQKYAIVIRGDGSRLDEPNYDNDARLIVAAINELPAMLDELEASRSNLEQQASIIAEQVEELERLRAFANEVKSRVFILKYKDGVRWIETDGVENRDWRDELVRKYGV